MPLAYQMKMTVSLETFISITGFFETLKVCPDVIITEFH